LVPLLSVSYLPPISYVAACVQSGKIVIDRHEHFVKQTHRNRALIYGANGILPLIIPVQHADLFNIPVHEVQIANDTDWQKIHWRSLVSAYRNSAYFDFFEDDFRVFYQRKFTSLYEFDLELLKLILRILQAEVDISYTASYQHTTDDKIDLRYAFSEKEQKRKTKKPSEMRYRQVFSAKHGFIPDLSAVDLLFNEGIKSLDYLSRVPQ